MSVRPEVRLDVTLFVSVEWNEACGLGVSTNRGSWQTGQSMMHNHMGDTILFSNRTGPRCGVSNSGVRITVEL